MIKLKNIIPIALLILISPILFGDEYMGKASFSLNDLKISRFDQYDCVEIRGGVLSGPHGAPALPCVQYDVVIPWNADIKEIRVLGVKNIPLEGKFNIIPMERPQHGEVITLRNHENRDLGKDKTKQVSRKDPSKHENDITCPRPYVEALAEWSMVGQRMIKLVFYPLHYNPVTKHLLFSEEIRFQLTWDTKVRYEEKKSFNLSNTGRAFYDQVLRKTVLNPNAISFSNYYPSTSRSLPAGQYDHVIITPQVFESDWVELADWRTQKGHPSQIITKEFIYSNFMGQTGPEKIREFIKEAHSQWGTRFILLGADSGDTIFQLPCHNKVLFNSSIPNDTFYADYNDDWSVDVSVGRASVSSNLQVKNYIKKLLTYEKDPPRSDYCEKVYFVGFDLNGLNKGEDTKIHIKNTHIPSSIHYLSEYDSETNAHKNDVLTILNDGPNIINHIGLCNWNVLDAGYLNHNDFLDSYDIQTLINGVRLGNWYSSGDYGNAWDFPTSISEKLLRNVDNGAVSFTGNTRYGWRTPSFYNTYSDLYDILWWGALFTDNIYHVGETLSAHKNSIYPNDDYYKYIFTEINLLGDPGMPIWKTDPEDIQLSCHDHISTGLQNFNLLVTNNGSPVEGAQVCVWKTNEVYERSETSPLGEVNIAIDPKTEGELTLTVTSQNHIPNIKNIIVIPSDPPVISTITPADGKTQGNEPCVIEGDHFTVTPDTQVKFGALFAQNVEVKDFKTITCLSPAQGAGAVDITVSTINGTDVKVNGFTYHDSPLVSSLNPKYGSIQGGTVVEVLGSNFTEIGATLVRFGVNEALNVQVINENKIICVSPLNNAGSVDITVENQFGSNVLVNGFTYGEAPAITSLYPSQGHIDGGDAISITGLNFTDLEVTEVLFGIEPAQNVVVINESIINCISPKVSDSGPVDVKVINVFGQAIKPNGFLYNGPPVISDIIPNEGPPSGNTFVTITGSNFTSTLDMNVKFGTKDAINLEVIKYDTLTCETPSNSSGFVDVTVISGLGQGIKPDGFFYKYPAPKIYFVLPDKGLTSGNENVVVKGDLFTPDTIVKFGQEEALEIDVIPPSTILCKTPAQSMGVVDVFAINQNGTGVKEDAFTYYNYPVITSIDKNYGKTEGNETVVITGDYFTNAMDVQLGGKNAMDINVLNQNKIVCKTPAHVMGFVDVDVSNEYGSDGLINGFFYADPPQISGLTPDKGPLKGGDLISIQGLNFVAIAPITITLGGVPCSDVNIKSQTLITCKTPASPSAGYADLVVSNHFGSHTLIDGYLYRDPYIFVPSDYISIQEAIDNSMEGDTIYVDSGQYLEILDFKGKAITVRSDGDQDPETYDLDAENTIIDGQQMGCVISFINQESNSSAIEGFTITNGLIGAGDFRGGGITCRDSSPVIKYNLIFNNSSNSPGGGINCLDSASPLISQNSIFDNITFQYGGGVACDNSNPQIENNWIYGNWAKSSDGGGLGFKDSNPKVCNNTICNNTADQSGGGVYCFECPGAEIKNTILWGNNAPSNKEISWGGPGGAPPVVEYCNVHGGWPGNKNINQDPGFKGPSGFALSKDSSCINRGENSEAPLLDYDGDVRPYQGTVDIGCDEFIEIAPLESDIFHLDASVGGVVNFALQADVGFASSDFIILGCVSGYNPGTLFPGGAVMLPMNWDLFTNLILTSTGSPIFDGFLGKFDASGSAVAAFNTFGPISGVPGDLVMTFAYAIYKAGHQPEWCYGSNPVNVVITK